MRTVNVTTTPVLREPRRTEEIRRIRTRAEHSSVAVRERMVEYWSKNI
jgi:hypothetical protein